jgi:polyferredoxin
MKRQKIRKIVLFISFLLLPLTLFYISPFLILYGASKGIINGSFIVFTISLLAGIFFGRAMCGWIMPCGGMQEACSYINNKRPRGGKLNYLKFAFWIPWLIALIIIVINAGGYKEINPFFGMTNRLSLGEQWEFIIYYIVVLLTILLSLLFGRRASCHYSCFVSPFMMVGRAIRNLFNLPALQLKGDSSKCTRCNICTKECPMSLDVSEMLQKGELEHYESIMCGACIDACKAKAIRFSFGRMKKNLTS